MFPILYSCALCLCVYFNIHHELLAIKNYAGYYLLLRMFGSLCNKLFMCACPKGRDGIILLPYYQNFTSIIGHLLNVRHSA